MVIAREVLKAEIGIDPLTKNYLGMTNANIAASLNAVTRTRNKTSVSASEVLNAVDITEYSALTADKKSALYGLLGIGEINLFGIEMDVLKDIFGDASATVTALDKIKTEPVSRAQELGLSEIHEGHVMRARA